MPLSGQQEKCIGQTSQTGMMANMSKKNDRTVGQFLSDGGSMIFTVIAGIFIALMIYGIFV